MGLILAGNILLQSSGGTSSPPSTGGSPGGSNTQIQFNDAGGFNGSANFTFNKTTGVVNFAYPPTIGGFAISTTEGTVTSISLSGGTTGLTTNGGPITSSGTITLDGTLAIANGGTGATTNGAAFNNLAPTQTTHGGKFLTTNGATTSWATIPGAAAVVHSAYGYFNGAVTSPTIGTSKKYFGSNITIAKLVARTLVAVTGDVSVALRVNGVTAATATILTGTSVISVTTALSLTADVDYVTLDVTSGSCSDLSIRFDY